MDYALNSEGIDIEEVVDDQTVPVITTRASKNTESISIPDLSCNFRSVPIGRPQKPSMSTLLIKITELDCARFLGD